MRRKCIISIRFASQKDIVEIDANLNVFEAFFLILIFRRAPTRCHFSLIPVDINFSVLCKDDCGRIIVLELNMANIHDLVKHNCLFFLKLFYLNEPNFKLLGLNLCFDLDIVKSGRLLPYSTHRILLLVLERLFCVVQN